LVGLRGAFSSNPTADKITVSDRDGVWLEIEDAEAVWTRRALFRGRLDIGSITAERVRVLRRPAGANAAADEGSSGLLVSIKVDAFRLPEVTVTAGIAGGEARLSAEGSAKVAGEAIAARLSLLRQDRPGTLAADFRLQPAENLLTANLQFAEPQDGLVAELLQLRNRPAVSVTVAGAGPLTAWQAQVEMQANGALVLAGAAAVSRADAGYRITADLGGALGGVAPEAYAALLSGTSSLAFDMVRLDDGGVQVQSASLRSDGIDLSASGALTPDFVPASAEASLRLGQAGRTILPFAPGHVSVSRLDATVGLDAGVSAPWRADVRAEGVESDQGSAGSVAFTARGQASSLADPAARATSFNIEGSAQAVVPADAAVAQALGPSVRFTADGAWATGQSITFESARTVLDGATASFSGTAVGSQLDGRFGASVTDLSRLQLLVDRPVRGGARLEANGRVRLAGGSFDLRLAGDAADLGLGIAPLDPLLAGTTRIGGGIARDAGGMDFDALTLANEQVNAELSGALGAPRMDLSAKAIVADLSSLTRRATGKAELSARVTGTSAAPEVEAEARGADVVLMGRPLAEATARFSGIVAGPRTEGRAELSAKLGAVPVRGSAELAAGGNGTRRIDGLDFSVGESRVSGHLAILADGLLSGELAVVSPDLSKVAPLFLAEASGMLKADLQFAAENGTQSARLTGIGTDLVYEGVMMHTAEIQGVAQNVFGAPRIDGSFDIRNLKTGRLVIVSATGNAERQGDSTAFSVAADLADGNAQVTGSLQPRGAGLAVGIEQFAFSRAGVDVGLAAPTTIAVANGMAEVPATRLIVGRGTVTVAGRAGTAVLNLTADIEDLPAALVNSFAPALDAEGTISGRATVTGAPAAPVAGFDASWRGGSVAATRDAGLGPLALTANGRLADKVVSLTSRISGAEGLTADVSGTVGIAPGAPLDIKVSGAAPLSLANRQLAERGAELTGTLDIDLAITGQAAAPVFAGRVTSEGGGFIDPATGITLRDLTLAASVSDNRLVVDRLSARSGDGSVSAEGSIGLDPAAGFPVDLAAVIRQARYVDGHLVSTRFDADLTLTGSLARGPVLGGSVFLDRTELTVPESLPRDSVAVGVEHVNTPTDVEQTLALARPRGSSRGASGGGGPGGGVTLDLTIGAPQQIFVRGRGLDAELGGEVRLTGPLSGLLADGAFEMSRGRLDILTQRITFDRGLITFAGDLDPILDFAGNTQSEDVVITVAIAGQASDPEIAFSSVPELPQDEVLAHLIFNRGIAELSPVQIARLADAAAQLAGGRGSGLLNQLRASTGLDDLDIVTDEEGGPALAAGRYVNENVYVGVQQGTSAESSRVTIDLDISDDVKARAGVSPQGNSSLGVFYEREY
ncbi:MAG: translocation/assembly module TamB domain-containing protein, partial [Rhizobiales bacterium]|nr:translocation/assembly module TamB domain-containing protein [Hyphomicrobiales bacterium]